MDLETRASDGSVAVLSEPVVIFYFVIINLVGTVVGFRRCHNLRTRSQACQGVIELGSMGLGSLNVAMSHFDVECR